MRKCIRCGDIKDESNFNWRNISKGYLQSVCKECQSNDSKSRDRENVRESNKTSRERGVERAQQYISEYLASHPCTDCGETDISVLTFHHTDPSKKKYNISDMVAHGYSLETIKREIEVCEVLCWNDHMRRERDGSRKGKKYWNS